MCFKTRELYGELPGEMSYEHLEDTTNDHREGTAEDDGLVGEDTYDCVSDYPKHLWNSENNRICVMLVFVSNHLIKLVVCQGELLRRNDSLAGGG